MRQQLDRIIVEINAESFRFSKVFPKSNKAEYFIQKEIVRYGITRRQDQVYFRYYALNWYELLKSSERVSGRTLLGYKSYLTLYLIPFFGKFNEINKGSLDRFIPWAKKRKYKKKVISNTSINKIFVPMKQICQAAAIEYDWGSSYNPFFGFKKLPEEDPYEKISPFSLNDQELIIDALPDHWKSYFFFAFCSGLRRGEQIGIKPDDIDWSAKTLRINRAITLDESGQLIKGKTKNRYSRRTIKLIPVMLEALKSQLKIYEQFHGEYVFCSTNGYRVCTNNLRNRIWIPALKKAGILYREMKQTRHSFATNALSCGENPLWIAKVMGHRDMDMIIKVYGKYIEDANGSKDGNYLNSFYQRVIGKQE